MKQQEINTINATYNIALQVALQTMFCSIVTAGIAVGLWIGLRSLGLAPVLVIALLALCCALVGLLLTSNIYYGLFILTLSLVRLAQGHILERQEIRNLAWPFAPLFASLQNISGRMRSVLQHEQSNEAYREQMLRRASEEAAEQERNRIARELHDSIKQQLFSIRMSAAAAQAQTGTSEGREAIADIQKSAHEAQVEMQALLQQLRSAALENTSLAEALRTQAQALGYRTGAQVFVEIGDLPSADFCPPTMQEDIFRIVQEAFANIARHARANTIWFTLAQQENKLAITVRDDGQGFDTHSVRRGMGSANIQERAHALHGTAAIHSEPGQGTTMRVSIPLLLSHEAKQDLDRREYEAQQSASLASGLLQLRITMTLLAIMVIVVSLIYNGVAAASSIRNFSLLIIGFSLLVIIYSMVSAHFTITRCIVYLGKETRETRSLRLQEHRARAGFWGLLIFVLWYALLFYPGWKHLHLTTLSADLLAASVVLPAFILVLSILERRPLYRSQDQYYALLSPLELSWEIQQRERRVRLFILIYLLCCLAGPVLALVNHVVFFPPATAVDVWNYFITISLIIFCINLVVEMNFLRRWKRNTIVPAAQKIAQNREGYSIDA